MGDNKLIESIEKRLGVTAKAIDRKKLQAAYALNLCSVSVSQIIDYNDINILEQEYEEILNNLNLENFPKDESLLDILKNILEVITFFRIQEGEKNFIEKDYRKKMKDAIWSAMPNPGALIMNGLSQGFAGAVSIAATVGTAYMNYRKRRAECQSEHEKEIWKLEVTALEQLDALRQQLLITSWRLADKYEYPDSLRLTVKQIKQYNDILMDQDDLRKYDRLDSVKNKFIAYPPFWYFFGHVANTIACSDKYGLNDKRKEYYREHARICFEYYSLICENNLLREDSIAASCYLEYADLLDSNKEKDKIEALIEKAAEYAGNSMDVLQLCAIAFSKINAIDKAAFILKMLVNEQYNEIVNAQLLSTLYVKAALDSKNQDYRTAYKRLERRVPKKYLFPMPEDDDNDNVEVLQNNFIKAQRGILKTKYKLVFIDFAKKYNMLINRIIPVPDDLNHTISDDLYNDSKDAMMERIRQVELLLSDFNSNKSKRLEYEAYVREIPYSYEILGLLNKMFASVCKLDFMQDEYKQDELQNIIKEEIKANKEVLSNISIKLMSNPIDKQIYAEIQSISLKKLTGKFFDKLSDLTIDSVKNMNEMGDFSEAEYALDMFCDEEDIKKPEILYANKDEAIVEDFRITYFTPDLLGNEAILVNDKMQRIDKMLNLIEESIGKITCDSDIEFFTKQDNIRKDRYFKSKAFKKIENSVKSKTLAVIDDCTKNDLDLIFTVDGIMPVIKGKLKMEIPYSDIDWTDNSSKKELNIGIRYCNEKIDMYALKTLVDNLSACKL